MGILMKSRLRAQGQSGPGGRQVRAGKRIAGLSKRRTAWASRASRSDLGQLRKNLVDTGLESPFGAGKYRDANAIAL